MGDSLTAFPLAPHADRRLPSGRQSSQSEPLEGKAKGTHLTVKSRWGIEPVLFV